MAARLSQFLASQVPGRSRSRGYSYFASGAVRSLTTENGIIEATVRGSEDYTVWIEPDRSLLRASCTCPYFIDRIDICKHIWAVVLAAEAQSIPLVTPGIRPEHVELEPQYPDDDAVDIDDQDDDRPWSPMDHPQWRQLQQQHAARFQRPQPRAAPPPPWKQFLDRIGASAAAPTDVRPRLASGQLLYVIDITASAASGAIVVELMTRDRKLNGEWGKPRTARVMADDIRMHPDEAERGLLERLRGPQPHLQYSAWDGFGHELTRLQLVGTVGADLVPQLCATGRCLLRLNNQNANQVRLKPATTTEVRLNADATSAALSAPLAWDDGPPWIFTAGIEPTAGNPGYAIEGWFQRGEERMELSEPLIIFAGGILFTSTHAARVNAGGAFAWLAALRQAGRIDVPLDARDALIDALLTSSPPSVHVPDDLRVETVDRQARNRLTLRRLPRHDRVRAELTFDYDGTLVPFDSPQQILRSPGSTRAIRRGADAEKQALDVLHQHGCRLEWDYETRTRMLKLAATRVPRVVRELLAGGWHVEAEGQLYRQPGPAALSLRSGIDWFELHGHVEYDNQRAALPLLLSALRRGETFVTLDDGSIGLLPEEWLRRQGLLARFGTPSGDHLRFTRSQAALLDALVAAQPAVSWDETFARVRAELRTFDGVHAATPPPTFTGTLRAYQREGLGWLLFLQRFGFGGCLADDMGLGKTVMVLALLASRREADAHADRRPSLVVAPRSVVYNWRQEAARFTPGLRVLEYVGSGRAAMRAAFTDHDIVLTTYGTLRRDAEALSEVPFDYVVLDEAQAIKNAASVSAKTTRVLQAQHRLALSGTPIENHLGELWSLFEFLNPGLLGTAAGFERASTGERLDDEQLALLARGLRPFILRRTKEQVASDLPPKTEQTLYCELEKPQRALYDELRAHYRRILLDGPASNGFGRAKLQVLEALLRLRQAACHPGLVDRRRTADASAKLDVLVPRLAEAVDEGHKTLVFSQFTSFLAILRARLDKGRVAYEYLDGRTRDRQSKIERFQSDPSCRLFLISLKAGGLGLNLTAAEYVFLLDPWWNPAVEAQAIDRAHRIGQARHVFAYRLIARDTVEERVVELQQSKRRLADAILTADTSLIRDLRREDLERLLS